MRCWLQGICVAGLAAMAAACGTRSPSPGTVQDEAMRAGLTPEYFRAATEDYFHGMDFNVVDGHPIRPFTQVEVQGRNMWLVWTGGNDRLWDRLTRDSLGTFDLLKTISSHPRVPQGIRTRSPAIPEKHSTATDATASDIWGPSANRVSATMSRIRSTGACGSISGTLVSARSFADALDIRASKSARAARRCRLVRTMASRRASSGSGSSPIPTSTSGPGSTGTLSGSTTIPATTSIPTWSARIASGCRAPSVTSVRTRSVLRPNRRTPHGRISAERGRSISCGLAQLVGRPGEHDRLPGAPRLAAGDARYVARVER